MANSTISGLTAAGALSGTEKLPLVQGGTTKRTTLADIATFAIAPAQVAALTAASAFAGTETFPVVQTTT